MSSADEKCDVGVRNRSGTADTTGSNASSAASASSSTSASTGPASVSVSAIKRSASKSTPDLTNTVSRTTHGDSDNDNDNANDGVNNGLSESADTADSNSTHGRRRREREKRSRKGKHGKATITKEGEKRVRKSRETHEHRSVSFESPGSAPLGAVGQQEDYATVRSRPDDATSSRRGKKEKARKKMTRSDGDGSQGEGLTLEHEELEAGGEVADPENEQSGATARVRSNSTSVGKKYEPSAARKMRSLSLRGNRRGSNGGDNAGSNSIYADEKASTMSTTMGQDTVIATAKGLLQHATDSDTFVQALQEGDLKRVKVFAKKESRILAHALDMRGRTALHYAAEAGHVHVAEFLLHGRASGKFTFDIDMQDSIRYTPLMAAAAAQQADVCLLLLQHGAAVDSQNDQGTTVFHYLVRILPSSFSGKSSSFGHTLTGKTGGQTDDTHNARRLEHLLDVASAKFPGVINVQSRQDATPLMSAVLGKNEVAVRWLLDRRVDWKVRNAHGVTAITFAEQNLELGIMEALVETMEAAIVTETFVLSEFPFKKSESRRRPRIFGSSLSALLAFEKSSREAGISEEAVRNAFDAIGYSHNASRINECAPHVLQLLSDRALELLLKETVEHEATSNGAVPRRIRAPIRLPEPATAQPLLTDIPHQSLVVRWIAEAEGEASARNIPVLLAALARHLRRFGVRMPGIFRESPDEIELRSLRCRIELFGIHEVLRQLPSPTAVSELIKSFLRDLPKPLLPRPVADRMLALGENVLSLDKLTTAAKVGAEEEEDEARACECVANAFLDDFHQDQVSAFLVFDYMIELLADIAIESAFNKMSAENLARMFGPLFVKSPSTTAKAAIGREAQISEFRDFVNRINAAVCYLIVRRQQTQLAAGDETAKRDDGG